MSDMDTAERLLKEARICLEIDEAQARATGYEVVAATRAALIQRIDAYLSQVGMIQQQVTIEADGRVTVPAPPAPTVQSDREGFYEKLWKDFVSLQRGDIQSVCEKVERYYREKESAPTVQSNYKQEWLCVKCDITYCEPPPHGYECVICTECGGDTVAQTVQSETLEEPEVFKAAALAGRGTVLAEVYDYAIRLLSLLAQREERIRELEDTLSELLSACKSIDAAQQRQVIDPHAEARAEAALERMKK